MLKKDPEISRMFQSVPKSQNFQNDDFLRTSEFSTFFQKFWKLLALSKYFIDF